MQPIPYKDLIPPFDWITYREPEDHLDAVAEKIYRLPELEKSSQILGLTFKDQTTLDRFTRAGYREGRIIDAIDDLGASDPNSNIETIQALLTPERAEQIVQREGLSDLLVVRHILEHCEDVGNFMQALSNLLHPGGYVVIEVPDCVANLNRRDYSMIWEEHVSYFTRETLPQVLAPSGFEFLEVDVHSYPFEDVLVLYAQKTSEKSVDPIVVPQQIVAENRDRGHQYGADFSGWSERYHAICKEYTASGKKLAAYGAGHLSCAFLNFHDLSQYFAFVVDDTPQKQGLFLPGTPLEIVPRSRLNAEEISLCLFGLAPEIEDKVIANNPNYSNAGGQFASMFVDSERSIRNLLR